MASRPSQRCPLCRHPSRQRTRRLWSPTSLVHSSYPRPVISGQRPLYDAALTGLRTLTCSKSMLAFWGEVNAACETEVYAFGGSVNQTIQQIVDPLVWACKVSCLTSGSSFCLPGLTNASTAIPPCSDCALPCWNLHMDKSESTQELSLQFYRLAMYQHHPIRIPLQRSLPRHKDSSSSECYLR